MRAPLLVSEWTLSNLKLTVVMLEFAGVLGDRARLACTLWSTTQPVLHRGRQEVKQIDFIVDGVS